MFISQFDKKSDESEDISDNDLDEKYVILQNNHRRLLGVTTALTEALECTVRGDHFDMEETLNQCMKIYPELFTLQHKKPHSKYFSKNKIYNTSEDITDAGSFHMIERKIESQNRYDDNQIKVKRAYKEKKNHKQSHNEASEFSNIDSSKSAFILGTGTDNSERLFSEFSSLGKRSTKLSGMTNAKSKMNYRNRPTSNLLEDSTNASYISDTTPFVIMTPDAKRNSISSQLDDSDANRFINMRENKSFVQENNNIHDNQDVVDENSYLVKHPESDNDQSNKQNLEEKNTHDIVITDDFQRNHPRKIVLPNVNEMRITDKMTDRGKESILNSASESGGYWPYEIIVQQTIPPQSASKHLDSEGNLLIKIKPESLLENENSSKYENPFTSLSNRINPSSVQTQTIITRPLETCIIITKHVDSGMHMMSDLVENTPQLNDVKDLSTDWSVEKKKTITNIETSTKNTDVQSEQMIVKNITIDKLQKLSTGLKVQSNEMQTKPTNNVEAHTSEKKVYNELTTRNPRYYATPYDLYDNYKIQNTSTNSYYKNLKEDLMTGSAKERATIIQSLRLTLIHTLAKERANLTISYIENDILNINRSQTLLENLLPMEIVNGWDLILQQMILKFINTMCSMWKGRDYITSNTRTISSLQNHFFERYASRPFSDNISQDMLIAVFHKLCTRENQQSILINTGVVEKIFYNVWEQYDSMTPYRLRHSLGLLINLCVYSNGRNLLESVSSEMLVLLMSLLKKKDKKITPYVARLIYVLMANEKFHDKAKEMDLLTALENSINPANKRLMLQMDVLKSVIENPHPHEYLVGTEENFLSNIEAEMDELEEEVEINEPSLSNTLPEGYIKPKVTPVGNGSMSIIKKDQFEPKNISTNVADSKINRNLKSKAIPKKVQVSKQTVQRKLNQRQLTNDVQDRQKMATPSSKNLNRKQNSIPILKQINKHRFINKHEIDEEKDDIFENQMISKSYVVLNEPVSNIVDDLKNDNIASSFPASPMKINEIEKTQANEINVHLERENSPKLENRTSFVVLSENDSNKSISLDLNLSSPTDSNNSAEQIQLPEDIKNADELLDKISSNADKNASVTNNNYFMIHTDGNPNVSLFIQSGKVTEVDYDYCEETKEIQSPIKYDNIFKDNRQSPYKGLLVEGQKQTAHAQTPSASKDDINLDKPEVEDPQNTTPNAEEKP